MSFLSALRASGMRANLGLTVLALLLFFLSGALGASGVTLPGNIVAYVPITLANTQGSAFAHGSQIMISVNSLKYQRYESSNLGNIEFFYSNGTVIDSWLEGNIANEQQTSNLYTSANTIYWVEINPANTFLAADSSNTIYMGFATNTINLFSNSITGEAPQLSPSYAQYDNGGNVFNTYLNFNGVQQPASWTFTSTGGSITVSNGLSITSESGESSALYYASSAYDPQGNVIDGYITSNTANKDELVGWTQGDPTGTNSGWWGLPYNAIGAGAGGGNPGSFELVNVNNGNGHNNKASSNPSNPFVASASWQGTSASATWNYSTVESNSTVISASSAYLMMYVNNGQTLDVQWFRERLEPPSGVMASASFSGIVANPTIALANSISSNSIDIIAGSQTDNALITASCISGDTCDIYSSNGVALASGTTTATLAYNALPLGYSALYANDITNGTVSNYSYVRRIATVNSLPITLTNYQSYAIPANAQLDIAFSGHNYTSVESNTLNNTVIYFSNGTVDYSWLEGGVTNNIEYPANVLSTSANVFFWFRAPPRSNAFLPANTGTATTNVIYLGFASPGNNIMDGNFIGEAPQLSSSYGEYDNGAKIFNYYMVNPTSTSGFTVDGISGLTTNAPSGSYFDTPNAFYAQVDTNNDYLYSNNPAFSPGNTITYWTHIPYQALGDLFFMSSSSGSGQFSRIDERGGYPTDSGFLSSSSWTSWSGGGNVQDPVAAAWDKVDIVITSSTSATMYDTPTSNTPIGDLGSASTGSQSVSNSGDYFGFQGDSSGSGTDYWDAVIVRDYLSGGSLVPASPYPSTYYTAPTLGALSPSSQSVSPGANALITDHGLSGGISPYSYQWYASTNGVPSATSANAAEANALLGIGTSNGEAQSQNAIFATNSLTTQQTYWFILNATDTYPTSLNSTAVSVTVKAPSSGGGSPPPVYYITLSDNINSHLSSQDPVITTYGAEASQYYQNQLPITLQLSSDYMNVSFACSVTIGANTFYFQNDAYGIGIGAQCNHTYFTSVGSIEPIYALAASQSTTTTTVSTVTSSAHSSSSSTSISTVATTVKTTSPTQTNSSSNLSQSQSSNVIVSVYSPAQLNFTSYNMQLSLKSSSNTSEPVDVVVSNVTANSSSPKGYSKIMVFDLNVFPSKNLSANVTLEYACSNDSIAVPFVMMNGTWVQIYNAVVLENPCRITFPAPNGHRIGIFNKYLAPANTTQTSQPTTASQGNSDLGIAIAALVVITLVLFLLYRRRRRRLR